jgi:hypothetical protein
MIPNAHALLIIRRGLARIIIMFNVLDVFARLELTTVLSNIREPKTVGVSSGF